MPKLSTIGYEQATAAAVLDELAAAKVDLVVDVRAVSASRRPGFSKRQLAAGLDERRIGYLHLRALGTPAEGRQAARSGRFDALYRIFEQHMATPPAREAMDQLTALARGGKHLCLLCYERDPHHCHRLRVAELVCQRVDAELQHLAAKLM